MWSGSHEIFIFVQKVKLALEDALEGKKINEVKFQALFFEAQKLREELQLIEEQSELHDQEIR